MQMHISTSQAQFITELRVKAPMKTQSLRQSVNLFFFIVGKSRQQKLDADFLCFINRIGILSAPVRENPVWQWTLVWDIR